MVSHAGAWQPNGHRNIPAIQLFDRNANYASLHHAKRTGSAQRYINDAAFDERPAVIDSAAYRVPSMRYRHDASERPGAMSAGHFSVVTASTVVGRKSSLSLAC